MSLGPQPTPARAFPAISDAAAGRARQERQRRLIAQAIPEAALRLTVDAASLSGRWSLIEARARALEQRLDARDDRAQPRRDPPAF